MNILSIQSWVAYGHVGNASAMFPLQRLGAEVWAVNTVQFSNHPGYGGHAGQVYSGDMIAALINGIADRHVFASCDGVLSGYVGDAGDRRRHFWMRPTGCARPTPGRFGAAIRSWATKAPASMCGPTSRRSSAIVRCRPPMF